MGQERVLPNQGDRGEDTSDNIVHELIHEIEKGGSSSRAVNGDDEAPSRLSGNKSAMLKVEEPHK